MAGSSPHTRGARCVTSIPKPPLGIIPAYAGSTTRFFERATMAWDHPRIRGEHVIEGRKILKRLGSSPHTRGALRHGSASLLVAGIIPAYAGSTLRPPRTPRLARDHPRIRGEHPMFYKVYCLGEGSSLHTRGALCRTIPAETRVGIIPAYAGSTAWDKAKASYYRDHPRIRGEHVVSTSVRNTLAGSSPHTRGARDLALGHSVAEGIIPAYAGSTRERTL